MCKQYPGHGDWHQQKPKRGKVWQVFGAREQSALGEAAQDKVGEVAWHLILESLEYSAKFGFGIVGHGEPLNVLEQGRA